MALSDLFINKATQPGLWFVKSIYASLDITKLVYSLAVKGSMYLQIYSSDKERIVNSVISMITKDRLRSTTNPDEHFYVENDISEYYERGFFWRSELNDYLPNGVFWDQQVWIYDYDPLFIHNCSFETIIIDDINGLHDNFFKYNVESMVNLLQQTEKLAIQKSKSVFVFVRDNTAILTNNYIRERLINLLPMP